MTSTPAKARVRKNPDERRAEILGAAAEIAVSEGLERITLRAVAERLDVRPGLITHYYPAAEDLVVAAFVAAVTTERDRLFPTEGDALDRLAFFCALIDGDAATGLARLWLNARHLSRFIPRLAEALAEQEQLDESRLAQLIASLSTAPSLNPEAAATRILMAVDGKGAYANDLSPTTSQVYQRFVTDIAEWTLGLIPGALTR